MSYGQLVERLVPRTKQPDLSASEVLGLSLRRPSGSSPLREIAEGKRSAAILIPGKARIAGTRAYVPALIRELHEAGIQDRNITLYLADGTHEQHLENDIAALLGKDIASRVRCMGHDCSNDEEVTFLGTTSYGTPVFINTKVLEADVKIITGRIVPHYFAGFSGGRKALVPGVAGFRTIVANHRLTLGPIRGIHPGVGLCCLDSNPVHLDMLEGARMAKPDFCLNTLLDAEHRIVSAVAGDFETAHREGCRQAEEMFKLSVAEPVDAVIASAGGLPYDSNFMQSLKAVFNIKDIVRPGGSILWIAECASGIHRGFLEWAGIGSDEQLEEAVRARYALTGHNSIMLRNLVRKADVALFSSLPADVVRKLGLHPVASLEEGIQWILQRNSRDFSYVVAPYANSLCATVSWSDNG